MTEVPMEWSWPCSLSDLLAVEVLSAELRASVERYVRSGDIAGTDPKDDHYIAGWNDGVEAMRDEISSAYVPAPSRPRRSNEAQMLNSRRLP